jgi:hypothetical protein
VTDGAIMETIDQKTLFTALAFVTVVQTGRNAGENETAEQIRQLASLIEAFCAQNVIDVPVPPSDAIDGVIGQIVERHIRELQPRQEIRLPKDKGAVAVVSPASGASAEALAAFIASIVNAAQQNEDVLRDAMEALEAVVNDGLNFTTEQAAEHVIANIRRLSL